MFYEVTRPALRRVRLREELPTDHPAILDDVAGLLDNLPDPALLCAEQRAGSMASLATLRNRIEAYLTAVAGEADKAADSRVLGAGTTGMLVAVATCSNPAAGSAIVNRAAVLESLPGVAAGFAAGALSTAHVATIVDAGAHLPGLDTYEQPLAEAAAHIEPLELKRMLDALVTQERPTKPDDAVAQQRERRGVSLTEMPDGRFRLSGWLDSLDGTQLRDALAGFMDRASATDRRTVKQRRADALADLVTAACANTRPLGVSGLSVLVDIEDLPDGTGATLDDGTPIGPDTFDLITCTAVATVLLGITRNQTFIPLELRRGARRASPGQWAALIVLDRGCIRCGRAPRFCEAHHILHWRHGGLTDLSNLVLLCSRCHHDLHAGRYTITMDTHGIGAHPHQSRTSPKDRAVEHAGTSRRQGAAHEP